MSNDYFNEMDPLADSIMGNNSIQNPDYINPVHDYINDVLQDANNFIHDAGNYIHDIDADYGHTLSPVTGSIEDAANLAAGFMDTAQSVHDPQLNDNTDFQFQRNDDLGNIMGVGASAVTEIALEMIPGMDPVAATTISSTVGDVFADYASAALNSGIIDNAADSVSQIVTQAVDYIDHSLNNDSYTNESVYGIPTTQPDYFQHDDPAPQPDYFQHDNPCYIDHSQDNYFVTQEPIADQDYYSHSHDNDYIAHEPMVEQNYGPSTDFGNPMTDNYIQPANDYHYEPTNDQFINNGFDYHHGD